MEKQKKQLIIICILLAVFVAAYFGLKALQTKEQEKEKQKTDSETVTAVSVNEKELNSFSYLTGGVSLTFEKAEGTWYYQEDHGIKIDQEGIKAMLSAVSSITTTTAKLEDADLAEFGLEPPVNTLVFHTTEGIYTVTLGMKNQVTGEYYVKNSESDAAYLIAADLNTTFSKTVEELTAKEEEADTGEP